MRLEGAQKEDMCPPLSEDGDARCRFVCPCLSEGKAMGVCWGGPTRERELVSVMSTGVSSSLSGGRGACVSLAGGR